MNTNNFFVLAIAVLISFASTAQSNDCGGTPPNLPINGSCVSQGFSNNQNGTGQTVNASCAGGFGTAYQDVWYTVTGTGSPITITLSGLNRNAVLAAFTSCGSGEVACNTINALAGGSIVFPSILGTTYFIQIQRRSGNNNNNQSGSICAVSAVVGPSNDDPCAATPLAVNTNCTYTSETNLGATASAGVPAPGCGSYSGGDVWFTITVPAGGDVTVETNDNGGMSDGGMAIYSGICSSLTLIECDDDDGPGAMPSITLTGQTPGATLWIRMWEFGNNNNGSFDICANVPPLNVTCTFPSPICSGSPIIFNAQSNGTTAHTVNPGNNYGCLSTTPNPSWFYLEIAVSGVLAIDITAGSDVDFAIYGPYANLATGIANCDSHGLPLDCSYSTSPTEQANVPGVLTGEVYILLVTNYASIAQAITVTDAPSNTATTNCLILPVELSFFGGERIGDENVIQWRTDSEKDNDYFAVERSSDGENWSAFEIVNGIGNSTSAQNYEVIDRNIDANVTYYRLKQFDFNGSMTTSNAISILGKGQINVSVFPNPAQNDVVISTNESFSEIQVVDIRGNRVKTKTFPSTNQAMINVSDLNDGIYYFNIITKNNAIVERVIVANK